MQRRFGIIKPGLFLLIALLIFNHLNARFQPYFKDWHTIEMMHDFYEQPRDTVETVFLGSSMAENGFIPMQLYNQYGLCSFNMGTPNQPVLASYFYLKEAYRLHSRTLKTVVLDVSSVCKDINTSQYHVALDGLRISGVKIEAMKACEGSFGPWYSSLFPLFTFHDRWPALEEYAFLQNSSRLRNVGRRGYGFIGKGSHEIKVLDENPDYVDAVYDTSPDGETSAAEIHGEQLSYLRKCADFCSSHDLSLILVKVPVYSERWDLAEHLAVKQQAEALQLPYFDLNVQPWINQVGTYSAIDTTDLTHLNYFGATKVTKWMGEYLSKGHLITDVRNDPRYAFMADEYKAYAQSVEKKIELSVENDPCEYVRKALGAQNCATFIFAKNDSTSAMTDAQRETFKSLDLPGLSQLGRGELYMAMILDGRVRYEMSQKDAEVVNAKGKLAIRQAGSLPFGHDYIISNESYGTGETTPAWEIDGELHKISKPGLNIVVYDYRANQTLDSAAFDTSVAPVRNADYYLRAQDLLALDTVDLDALDEATRRIYRYCQRCRDQALAQQADAGPADGDLSK